MKPIMLVTLLIGLFMPVYGQQQLCFSTNCPETPAMIFRLDRSNHELDNIFRRSSAMPAYKPVAPLTFSPSARQFFLDYVPPVNGLKLPNLGSSFQTHATGSGSITGTHAPSRMNSSYGVGSKFSAATGGISFTPASPKF